MRGKHNNHFTGRRKNTKYISFICKRCSIPFDLRESEVKVRKIITFCSNKCKNSPDRFCINCDSKIESKDNRIKTCSRECSSEYRLKQYSKWRDKEYIGKYMKEYSKTKSAIALRKKSTANRRAIIRGKDKHFTKKEWVDLCDKYNNKCLCCGSIDKLSPDHIIPLIKGGENTIDNIQPLCLKCNRKKWKDIVDYR